ncbi:MAG TPA: hypothetical protein ENO09_05430, partial [bacterium]|nr:hypothetical protein [bacterium]
MNNLHSALQYAAIGWEIFPCWWVGEGACACGNPACKSPGKHPIGAVVPGGQNNATTDEATIRAWFERYPKANIAVALATSGLCAVDVDPRNGGLTSFEALEEQYGKITSDVMQFTGGGGQHYVFHAPKDAVLPGALGKGVDFKHNGYIMVEPSDHVQGDYAWEMSSDPREGIVPSPLPDWISALGRTPQQKIMEMSSGKRHIHIGVMAELQSALSHIPADDRDMWVRIGLALREGGQEGFTLWDQWSKKSDKYNPVDAYRTWHSFKPRGEIAYESVFFIAEEHGWVNPQRNTSIPLVEIPQAPAPEVDIQPLKIPEAQACPVDVVNRLADWVHSSSDQANSLVSQAVALSILCASAGRRYQSEHGDPAAVYFGVLAPSASYGRGAVALAERAMNEAGLKELVRSMRIGSPAQLLSTLYRTPALFYIAEDYGDQLRFSKRQSSGVLDQCLLLLGGKVWSSPSMFTLDNWAEVGMKRGEADEDRPTFRHPTVTMLALVS